jgi:hypothetical protein
MGSFFVYVASFSGLSIFDCFFGICNVYFYLKQIYNIIVSSSPHITLNSSRKSIRYGDHDLEDLTDDEICHYFKSNMRGGWYNDVIDLF